MRYVMVESRGGHGVHSYGQFDAFRPVHRQIWIGSDGSGRILEHGGPCTFFTPAGRAGWERAGSPPLGEGVSDETYGPGELALLAVRLLTLPDDPAAARRALEARPVSALNDVTDLLGETIAPPSFRLAAYASARSLPDVEAVADTSDRLGRAGRGLTGPDQDGNRSTLVFDDAHTLLGYQRTLHNPREDFAPAGTLISWAAFVMREVVDQVPAGATSPR